jgi:hypothetical protein
MDAGGRIVFLILVVVNPVVSKVIKQLIVILQQKLSHGTLNFPFLISFFLSISDLS